ncbi:4'-phosphopantetheinyl transferase superfamily protein [Viridibacillus arvi]|uniref:4'-phosphopantetheinyl transferase family protein n=1 Tax=Viridibacillus arvi TaxID=263475 RepID=UPI003D2C88E1
MNSIDKRHYRLLDTCILENRKRYLNSISNNRKKTIFAGDILLRYALLKENHDISEIKLLYGANGKPFIKKQHINYNLSHSKDIIILGITKEELGIDILYERKINNNFINFFFSKEEKSHLHSLVEKEKREYYWNTLCYKEAFIKRHGGRIIEMKNNLICPKNLQYGRVIRTQEKGKAFESIFFKNLKYHICIISDKIPQKIKVEILNMDEVYKKLNF